MHSQKTESGVDPKGGSAERAGFSRRTLPMVMMVSLLGIVSLLNGCDTADTPLKVPTEREPTELAQHETAPKIAIPPIDAAAPTETQTATFSLG